MMITRRLFFRSIGALAAVVATAGLPILSPMARRVELSLAEIVARTLRARSGQLADNVMQNTALLVRMKPGR